MNYDLPEIGDFTAQEKDAARQKCFLGYSHHAWWSADTLAVCRRVLPEFQLELWADIDHYETDTLRKKVVGMIANTHFGIYDLSAWRKSDTNPWMMPRNVLIELGIAIAFNRPMLLLRHASNSQAGVPLPACLESMKANIVEFSGSTTLERLIREKLAQREQQTPEQDWQNRYCTFGERICGYREVHPYQQRWEHGTLHCHISAVSGSNRPDVRHTIEESLGRFEHVEFTHLDALPPKANYQFLLCSHCQAVRKSPFALYYITPNTPAETYIAIGISLALETQFKQSIPKIFLTHTRQDIPSLLDGYEVIEVQSEQALKPQLRQKLPLVLQYVKQTHYRARPLPFIVSIPKRTERPKQPEQQLICTTCGNANRADAKFCTRCGNPLTVAISSIDPPTEPNISNIEKSHHNPQIVQVIGEYGLIRLLGRGGFSSIYFAQHIHTKSLAVVKILPESVSLTDSERFLAEGHMLANLKHPNIVKILDIGIESNRPYFIVDYAANGSLDHIYRQSSKELPMTEAIKILSQIGSALFYIHKRGIIHRDVKPPNILLDAKGNALLTDFGIAILESELTEKEGVAGTPLYMAPEQIVGKPVAASDQYALGCVAYELITGKRPFEGNNINQLIYQHLHAMPASPREINPDIPIHVEQAILKGLAKESSDRFPDVMDFVRALQSR